MDKEYENYEIKTTLEDQIASMLEQVMSDEAEDDFESNNYLFSPESLEMSTVTNSNEFHSQHRKKDKAHTMNINDQTRLMVKEGGFHQNSQILHHNGRSNTKKFHTSAISQNQNMQGLKVSNFSRFVNKNQSYNQSQNSTLEDYSDFSPINRKQSNGIINNNSNVNSGIFNQSTNNSFNLDFNQMTPQTSNNYYNFSQFHLKYLNQKLDNSECHSPEVSRRTYNGSKTINYGNISQMQSFHPIIAIAKNSPYSASYSPIQSREVMISEVEANLRKIDRIDENLFAKLKGNFITIIQTQNGSRLFQTHLKNTSPSIIKKIYRELKGNLLNMMTDPYANYFCQKIYGFLNKDDQSSFIKEVKLKNKIFRLFQN